MVWRPLLLPLAPLYRGAVAVRTSAYARGLLPRSRLAVPVVSVGNLTFGGTGKTPMVIALVRDLVRHGHRPAVLTRGYRRHDDRLAVVVGPVPRQRADEVGDEPVEMARRLPGIPVVVSADRALGGREAVRLGADVVVLDDGFQHLRLERDLDVLLLDAGDPWGGGRLPPMGRLREPVSGLGRADAVVITKVPLDWRATARAVETAVREIAPRVPVLVARLRPSRLRRPDGAWAPSEELDGRRVLAFAGVGRPGGFRDSLEEAGAEVVGERWFRDHHEYAKDELAEVMASSEELKAIPVTTAKDAVKLSDDAGVWVLESEMVPVAGGWQELWRLLPEVAR